MAEFAEVMKQAWRMCASFGHECNEECPLDWENRTNTTGRDLCIPVGSGDSEIYEEVERRVMQWAAEHPEPEHSKPEHDGCVGCKYDFAGCNDEPCKRCRYNIGESAPDLYEGAEQWRCIGIIVPEPEWCNDSDDSCEDCVKRPMPADIAEKLGIKPIATKGQETVHNGCAGCKHILKSLFDDPCAKCRGWTLIVSGDKHGKLWEEG